ncbi:MAG TPA: ABC transporter permease [Pseudolabrys sp.]|nr:ABC transporter permease [Pseudolabrys sp.]
MPARLPFHLMDWLWQALPLVIFVVLWHLLSNSGLIDKAFLPEPSEVFAALLDLLRGPQVVENLAITLFRSFTGLLLGAVAGVWIGLFMARSEVFRAYVTPIVGGTYSLPKSALIPLFILWFGIGSVTAICAVFLACLLPMIVNTYHGVSTTPKVLVWSAEAMGYSQRQMLTRIFLPHAMPDIMTGLRIALGFSFVLAISSEMIAATSGIGKLIFMYGENGAYSYMFAAIACIVAAAFLSDRIMLWITRICLVWHESAVVTETA